MNILAPRLHDCRWLDLCSGSGVMGCEALQRGALCVVAVDQDPQCIRTSRANLSTVAMDRSPTPEIRTERRELIGWLRRGWREDPFDIVYFDPPYDQGLYEPGLDALAQGNWLHQDSLVVCEYRSNLNPVPGSGWPVLDQRRYGISSVLLLSPPEHCRRGGTGSMPPQTAPSE
jgi:16S rRNA (guanine(966)-N(2))-methyltransferase RsmD